MTLAAGDGIHQHGPNEMDAALSLAWPAAGQVETTTNHHRVIMINPYRLPSGYQGRAHMASGTPPGAGDDYPGSDYTSGGYPPGTPPAGLWYQWLYVNYQVWPDDLVLVIEGCTHNGSSITEGTRYFLELFPAGGSPADIPTTRPFMTLDGRPNDLVFQRFRMITSADFFRVKTTGLPTVTMDGGRLYTALFDPAPDLGNTVTVLTAPAAGDTEIELNGLVFDPLAGGGLWTSRMGTKTFSAADSSLVNGRVVRFGGDPVRYCLRATASVEATPGNWECTCDIEPPILARTVTAIGADNTLEFLSRHEIPVGKKFDIALRLSAVARDRWNGAAFIATDPAEWLVADCELWYSWFEVYP